MTFQELDKLRIEKYGKFSEDPNATRMRRATSWGVAAENAEGEDEQFMFLWIALNAAYNDDETVGDAEREKLRAFFAKICALDEEKRISRELIKIPNQFRVFVDNKYVYDGYWKTQSGDWTEEKFENHKKHIKNAIYKNLMTASAEEEVVLLDYVFYLMALLRNQIFHGLATYKSSANRDQLKAGLAILKGTVPIMIELVLKSEGVDWGEVSYPYMSK